MATERNLTVYEGDDTPVTFELQRASVAFDLTGGTIKVIIKTDKNKADGDSSTVTYSTATSTVTILNQTSNKGQCSTTFFDVDLRNKPLITYRVQYSSGSEKRVYLFGRVDRVNV